MEEKKKTVFADLGQKGYREVWELQERLLEKVKAEKAGNKIPENHLLFVEHDPVYTLGKSGNEANMLISAIQLRAKHAEFIKVDRGGDITFHGPGQLVVYPVIDLESFGFEPYSGCSRQTEAQNTERGDRADHNLFQPVYIIFYP